MGLSWSREDLLNATLNRDQGSRWRQVLGEAAPCLGDGNLAEQLAVIATIAGGLDCPAATRRGLIAPPDSQTRRQALVLVDGALGRGASGPSQQIPALQPDLLGEWLVLSSMQLGLPVTKSLDLAWGLDPDQTAAFLSRLSQDFPDHPVTGALLDREAPDVVSASALTKVASAIVMNLYRARHHIPKAVVDALTLAAYTGDARAMNSVGYCLWGGPGCRAGPGAGGGLVP